jgi:hypothetical protein
MYFEYSINGGTSWTNVLGHTGNRNNTYNYTLSNNINRFRFRLVTDGSVNSSGGSVYYYDIDYFNISCNNVLPIELILFEGVNQKIYNYLTWKTVTETNNDYFKIERSGDAIQWEEIVKIKGAGDSQSIKKYSYNDYKFINGINYYKLTQFDLNGDYKSFQIISIDSSKENYKITRVINLLGQEVDSDFSGPRIIFYEDGSVIKKTN